MKLDLNHLHNQLGVFQNLPLNAHLAYNHKQERVFLQLGREGEPDSCVYGWAVWYNKNWWLSDGGITIERWTNLYPDCLDEVKKIMPLSFEITNGNKIISKIPKNDNAIVTNLYMFLNALGRVTIELQELYGK